MRPETVADVLPWQDVPRPRLSRVQQTVEHAVAMAYGAAYDAVVDGFAPYQRLLDDIVELLDRAAGGRRLRILDVACGTGTAARRLAREGHQVIGVDPVAHLIARARRTGGKTIGFAHADVAAGNAFPAAGFDACVSLHTINWHPRPLSLLAECRRLLRPGGHAIILAYTRPAAVGATFAAVHTREGIGRALAALRWLLPTAAFEAFRHYTPRYPDVEMLHRELRAAGFEVRDSRPVFLADLSRLVWAQAADLPASLHSSIEETS